MGGHLQILHFANIKNKLVDLHLLSRLTDRCLNCGDIVMKRDHECWERKV